LRRHGATEDSVFGDLDQPYDFTRTDDLARLGESAALVESLVG